MSRLLRHRTLENLLVCAAEEPMRKLDTFEFDIYDYVWGTVLILVFLAGVVEDFAIAYLLY